MGVLRDNAGLIAWGAVGTAIIATEILSPETLSTASDRMLRGEYGELTRRAWQIGAGVLFLHTMNLIPERVDPIHQIAGRLIAKTNIESWSL